MFYEQFDMLCAKKGVSKSRAALENNISKTSVTRWKNGAEPNPDILKRLSEYFDVSIDCLLGNEQKNKPIVKNDEFSKRIELMLENVPDNEKESLISVLEGALRAKGFLE